MVGCDADFMAADIVAVIKAEIAVMSWIEQFGGVATDGDDYR